MSKALIAVDMENDFANPEGSLAVAGGQDVVEALIDHFDNVDVIVLTRDWHPADHVSFSDNPEYVDGSWPSHGVQDTWGAEINDRLFHHAVETGKPLLIVKKGFEQDKEAYSGFEGRVQEVWNLDHDYSLEAAVLGSSLTKALILLDVRELLIGGLALDYCVKATAIDGTGYGPTTVDLVATRPVSYLTGARAVRDLAAKGVRLV